MSCGKVDVYDYMGSGDVCKMCIKLTVKCSVKRTIKYNNDVKGSPGSMAGVSTLLGVLKQFSSTPHIGISFFSFEPEFGALGMHVRLAKHERINIRLVFQVRQGVVDNLWVLSSERTAYMTSSRVASGLRRQ